MKIALISDIHANWQALEGVLRDCPAVDETLCLGDVVGYGGDPKKCVDEVTKRGWLTLVGNHDRAAGGQHAGGLRHDRRWVADVQQQPLGPVPGQ